MKKYLLFTNSLNGGGAEKVICLLSNHLAKDGHDVTLVKIDPAVSFFEVLSEVKQVSLWDKSNYKPYYRLLYFPIITYNLWHLIKESPPQYLISFLPIPNFMSVVIGILLRDKIKVVINERCYPSKAYRSSLFRYLFYKVTIPYFYNKADFIFANSPRIISDLKENFNLKIEGQVFYNPIGFNVLRTRNLKSFSLRNRIVMVGRLSKEKGYETALHAIKKANQSTSVNFELHVYGIGSEYEKLMVLVTDLGLNEFVFFHGFKKNIKEHIKKYDIFLMTSLTEGFPNAMIEAMAIGLPVVSTDCVSGPLEILNLGDKLRINFGDFKECKFGILTNIRDIGGIEKGLIFLNQKENYVKYSKKSLIRAVDFESQKVFSKFINTFQNE